MNRFENKPHLKGYQPKGRGLDVTNAPQGGSGILDLTPNSKLRTPNCRILTTPEQIVRDYRNHKCRERFKTVPYSSSDDVKRYLRQEAVSYRAPSSILERILKIFLWITLGWMIGYLHHFLAG